MMKKRFFFALFAITMLTGGGLLSCGEAIDPTGDWTIDVDATKGDITLNTYFPAFGQSNDKVQNGFIANELEEMTGYKVTYNQTSESNADTQVQAILTGKEAVDVLKISPTLFNNYVTQGYFTDLTEGIEKYGDNINTVAEISEEEWEACTYNGKVYAIPEVGHTSMVNVALVWNYDHLKEVGITKIPETLSEFDTAVKALQAHFGENNANYHALGLAGTNAEFNPITAAFDMPKNWFENENGELENALFSDRTEAYLNYMHSIYEAGCLAQGWSTQMESSIINNFVNQNCSVMNLSYWNVTNLRQSCIASYDFPDGVNTDTKKTNHVYGTLDHEYGFASGDAMIQWQVYLKGDGTNGTNYQEVGKSRDSKGIAYYIVVPVASAKRAAYSLDWINSKMEEDVAQMMSAGVEGTHFEYSTADDEEAVELITEDGEEKEYAKILDQFNNDISGMSQYQTGVNKKVARKWWPLAEQGFDAWSVLALDDSRVIYDPFAVHPVLPNFARVDLTAQNYVITQLQNCINQGGDTLANARNTYTSRYWTDTIKNEVNDRYKSSKN